LRRLAGNSDTDIVGADSDMGGVDVSTSSGNNGVVRSLQEKIVVDDGLVDSGVVDQGSVESSSVEQGGVSLGLTLGDVGHNGGGLEAGEDLAQEGSGQRGVVDHGSMDSGVVDHGSLDSGLVDHGSLDSGLVDHGSLDSGLVDHGSLDSGLVDHGSLDRSIVDHGSMETRGVDKRGVDSRLDSRVDSGQSVGVDQSWVSLSLRLSFSLSLAV